MAGVTIINAVALRSSINKTVTNGSLYLVFATTIDGRIPNTVKNASYRQLTSSDTFRTTTNPFRLFYDANAFNDDGMPIATTRNSQNFLSRNTILPFVWLNSDPSRPLNRARRSDAVNKLDSDGQMITSYSTSYPFDTSESLIMQYSGINMNSRAQYIVYWAHPLRIINRSGVTLRLRTMASSANRVTSNSYLFGNVIETRSNIVTMSRDNGIISDLVILPSDQETEIIAAFPSTLYTNLFVFTGQPMTGRRADYAVNFRPYDFTLNNDIVNGSPSIRGTWNSESGTIILEAITPLPIDNASHIGSFCRRDNDCSSMNCRNGVCVSNAVGFRCSSDSDCSSGNCLDGICAPLLNGSTCTTNSDCSSNNCSGGVCMAASAGTPCTENSDCSSGTCSNGFCQLAEVGDPCFIGRDCQSGNCQNASRSSPGVCGTGSVGSTCLLNSDCSSQSCINSLCVSVGVGSTCSTNNDCSSGSCMNGICTAVVNGSRCGTSGDCLSGNCLNGVCVSPTSSLARSLTTTSNTVNNTTSTTNVQSNTIEGVPWWGWIIMLLIILLIVGGLIIIITMSRSSKSETGKAITNASPSSSDVNTRVPPNANTRPYNNQFANTVNGQSSSHQISSNGVQNS